MMFCFVRTVADSTHRRFSLPCAISFERMCQENAGTQNAKNGLDHRNSLLNISGRGVRSNRASQREMLGAGDG
jgi:hypothetical protein